MYMYMYMLLAYSSYSHVNVNSFVLTTTTTHDCNYHNNRHCNNQSIHNKHRHSSYNACRPKCRSSTCPSMHMTNKVDADVDADVDVEQSEIIVIGSGLAGLSCAALLAHCDYKVTVLESHDTVGGCAHGWERRGFHFESGPSLYSGFSIDKSPNPLKNVFQIIEEEPEWITYDRWGTVLPEGKFAAKIGPEEFGDVLDKYGGDNAKVEFESLMKRMEPLSDAAQALTSMAIREDIGAVFTLGRYPKELFETLKQGQALNDPFELIMDEMKIENKFVKNWLDMLCFLLQGLPATGTMNAVMAYMLADWYRPGVTLDFPKGGSGAIAEALVRGIEKKGGKIVLRSHVSDILVEEGTASGVQLKNGKMYKASKAVVSNADPFVTKEMFSKARSSGKTGSEMDAYMDKLTDTSIETGIPMLKSFIHIHAGIDATGLPEVPSAEFPAQVT